MVAERGEVAWSLMSRPHEGSVGSEMRASITRVIIALIPPLMVCVWPGWVCAYTREEGALAVALAPPGVPRPVGVPVICLRGPNREQISYNSPPGKNDRPVRSVRMHRAAGHPVSPRLLPVGPSPSLPKNSEHRLDCKVATWQI